MRERATARIALTKADRQREGWSVQKILLMQFSSGRRENKQNPANSFDRRNLCGLHFPGQS